MDIPTMRRIEVTKGDLKVREKVEVLYERKVTRFGNSAKIDAPKRYIGKRVYVIILKD